MANITGSSSSSSSSLQAAPNTITYIAITFIIAILAIILNSAEIHLIRQKWKKATDFEVLLLNLGIADLLSGIGFVVLASLRAVNYPTKPSSISDSLVAFSILGFFCVASAKLVITIGIERLLAIKLPLKHRLWHTNRMTMYKTVLAVWIASFVFINSVVISGYLIQKSKGQKAVVSRNLGYAFAAYLTLCVCTVFVTYSWLTHLVIKRATNLLNFDKKEYKQSPQTIKIAVKKEKATIVICRLVAATYLVCNVPIVVALYRGKFDSVSISLTNLNAVINPLIYFFKGFAEKWYAKKKLVVSLSDAGGSNDNLGSPSPKVLKSESYLHMKEVNKVTRDKSLNQNGRGSGSSRDKGERPINQFESTHKARNDDLSQPNDQESNGSMNKGEERQNSLQSSVERERQHFAEMVIENDQEARSSKDVGEEHLGEKLDSFIDIETVNLNLISPSPTTTKTDSSLLSEDLDAKTSGN